MNEIPTLTSDERKEALERIIGKVNYTHGIALIDKLPNGFYCDLIDGWEEDDKRRKGTIMKICFEIDKESGVIMKNEVKYHPEFVDWNGHVAGGEKYCRSTEILEILSNTNKTKLLERCLDYLFFNISWASPPTISRHIGAQTFKDYVEDLEKKTGKKLAKRIIEREREYLREVYNKLKNNLSEEIDVLKSYGVI